MDTYGILSIGSAILSVGSVTLGIINHKRIRSTCCGRRGEVSFDIDNTSPLPKTQSQTFDPKSALDCNQTDSTKPQLQVSASAEP